ncbi:hypothetical protein AVEN_7390-1 [Araneus ventricosus]|uniref:Uncharacterized protein n=1 Tax=Araneus ventricosus TaxID=182803 RepID=A0A4Y2BSL1_ARAVE|nr:hypothetical protein AVEN_7390-1 [Araneus ventricosus]
MTKTTPSWHSSPKFRTSPTRGRLYDLTYKRQIHDGFSVESSFEPRALRLRGWYHTTRPTRAYGHRLRATIEKLFAQMLTDLLNTVHYSI